jgi:hypothetical protein
MPLRDFVSQVIILSKSYCLAEGAGGRSEQVGAGDEPGYCFHGLSWVSCLVPKLTASSSLASESG